VAAQQAARVDDELRAERPIEPVLGAKRLHHRLGGVGAGGQAGRVAGDHVRDRERDAEQPEQQHAENEKPFTWSRMPQRRFISIPKTSGTSSAIFFWMSA